MKARAFLICCAVVALGTVCLWGFVSQATPAESQRGATGDEALIDQLVLVNRILASKEVGVFGAYGHVSVRGRSNSNSYFISRAVSPALVVAKDIYESDLDSQPVAGNRSNLLEERFVHGEIYKARPDVMAIAFSNAPELVAFSVSSIPLARNNRQVPVFDIRKADGGRNGIINSPALGRTLAESLGRGNAALMFGQGAVVVSSSTTNLVSAALGLRTGAEERLFEISLGGTLNHITFTREKAMAEAGGTNLGPSGSVERIDRFAAFFNYLGARDLARAGSSTTTAAQAAPESDQSIIQDLVIANRLLASPELGVLTPDGLAHVSARSRSNPDHFFIARDVSPGMVTATDIIENDLDTRPVKGGNVPQYSERFIHAEIYRARPDVMAVLHAHTPELRIFGQSSVKLRPVLNKALFIGDGLPIFDLSKFTGGAPSPISCPVCISTPELGRALVGVMGKESVVLLLDHGIAVAGASVRGLVSRAYNLRMNARIQQITISLGGNVNYFDEPKRTTSDESGRVGESYPEWDYWKQIVLGSTDINSVPKSASGLPMRVRQ